MDPKEVTGMNQGVNGKARTVRIKEHVKNESSSYSKTSQSSKSHEDHHEEIISDEQDNEGIGEEEGSSSYSSTYEHDYDADGGSRNSNSTPARSNHIVKAKKVKVKKSNGRKESHSQRHFHEHGHNVHKKSHNKPEKHKHERHEKQERKKKPKSRNEGYSSDDEISEESGEAKDKQSKEEGTEKVEEIVEDLVRSQGKVVELSPTKRYVRFNELLGEGSFKKVYLAYDTKNGVEVAWNVIKFANMKGSTRMRILQEMKILQTLNHKSIMKFYNSWFNAEKRQLCFITEAMSSGTLKDFSTSRPVSVRILKRWCRHLLNALVYLHEEHDPPVIHRDLKCDNIFINGTSGEIRIGDLGLASWDRTGNAKSVLGTPEYMAPEMFEESYDEKVDIYAFGMCVLELITKETPYSECQSTPQVYRKVISGKPPACFDLIKDGEPVKDFIWSCIRKPDTEKGERRPSANELREHPFLKKDDAHDDLDCATLLKKEDDAEKQLRKHQSSTSMNNVNVGNNQNENENNGNDKNEHSIEQDSTEESEFRRVVRELIPIGAEVKVLKDHEDWVLGTVEKINSDTKLLDVKFADSDYDQVKADMISLPERAGLLLSNFVDHPNSGLGSDSINKGNRGKVDNYEIKSEAVKDRLDTIATTLIFAGKEFKLLYEAKGSMGYQNILLSTFADQISKELPPLPDSDYSSHLSKLGLEQDISRITAAYFALEEKARRDFRFYSHKSKQEKGSVPEETKVNFLSSLDSKVSRESPEREKTRPSSLDALFVKDLAGPSGSTPKNQTAEINKLKKEVENYNNICMELQKAVDLLTSTGEVKSVIEGSSEADLQHLIQNREKLESACTAFSEKLKEIVKDYSLIKKVAKLDLLSTLESFPSSNSINLSNLSEANLDIKDIDLKKLSNFNLDDLNDLGKARKVSQQNGHANPGDNARLAETNKSEVLFLDPFADMDNDNSQQSEKGFTPITTEKTINVPNGGSKNNLTQQNTSSDPFEELTFSLTHQD